MCFLKWYVGLGFANLEADVSETCKREGGTRYWRLFLPPHPHLPSEANTGIQTRRTNTGSNSRMHICTVLRKRSDPDLAQKGDSGDKHRDFNFLKVRWICFLVREMGTTYLNSPLRTLWERGTPDYFSGSFRPVFSRGMRSNNNSGRF